MQYLPNLFKDRNFLEEDLANLVFSSSPPPAASNKYIVKKNIL